jgi:hypothetical protein
MDLVDKNGQIQKAVEKVIGNGVPVSGNTHKIEGTPKVDTKQAEHVISAKINESGELTVAITDDVEKASFLLTILQSQILPRIALTFRPKNQIITGQRPKDNIFNKLRKLGR